jgi:hypothetical protein
MKCIKTVLLCIKIYFDFYVIIFFTDYNKVCLILNITSSLISFQMKQKKGGYILLINKHINGVNASVFCSYLNTSHK